MIEKLEIHHLKTFDAIYRFSNLSAAAEHLNISQQAVSLQLKKMREIMSDDLFTRAGHGMVATAYAITIQPHVHKILTQLNEIPLPDSVDLSLIERTLVISATDYTQEIIVADLIKEIRASFPKIKIIVRNIEVSGLIVKMQHGSIDLVLTSHGYVPDGLVCLPLFTEKYSCVTANPDAFSGDGLHNKKKKSQPDEIPADNLLAIEKLVDFDFVVTSPGIGSLTGSANNWFQQQGLQRNTVISAPSFHMTKTYLKKSDMVGFLPSRLLPCEGLFEIPLNKYPPGYEVVAAYHPVASKDPLMIWLLDTIKHQFSLAI